MIIDVAAWWVPMHVHVDVEQRRTDHAVARFPDPQHVAGGHEPGEVALLVLDVGDRHQHVDDRLRGQARDGRGADVLDRQRDGAEGADDALPFPPEPLAPGRDDATAGVEVANGELVLSGDGGLDGWNDRAHPFTWTKTADDILDHARTSKRKKTSYTRHRNA